MNHSKIKSSKILVSSVLSALLAIPAMAVQVYEGNVKGENIKVDVYGSIRTFAGGGANIGQSQNGTSSTGKGHDYEYGSLLLGLQGNSHFGIRTSYGRMKTNIQFGANENAITSESTMSPGLRELWGSYDFGPLGTILIGKATTPTVDNGYTANWFNTDNGMQGFGGEHTGDRKIQIQYHIAGLKVAVIEDDLGALAGAQTITTAASGATPRLAINYEMELPAIKFKVGANYKHYNNYNTSYASGIEAWNVVAGVKPTFGPAYLSVLLNVGQNSWLYGAQRVVYNSGGYAHTLTQTDYLGRNGMIFGGVVTFGMKLTNELSFAVGAGYQLGKGANNATLNGSTNGEASSFAVYANLPYQVSKGFSIVPQVAYYSSELNSRANGVTDNNKSKYQSVLAAIRFKFDF